MYSGPSSGSDSGPGRSGIAADLRPHAYDPASNPELFEGVLTRRVVAFTFTNGVVTGMTMVAGMASRRA